MKIIFLTCSLGGPIPQFIESLEASLPPLDAVGHEHQIVEERGNVYISYARAQLLWKAMKHEPDCVIYLDFDLSWDKYALLRLIETQGDVVGGTYRFKKEEEEYMGGIFTDASGFPTTVRADGCIAASLLPAGFLKITKGAIETCMKTYPELIFGPQFSPRMDLFNHGAFDRTWYGEDYAFSRRWLALGQPLWLIPDLNITHHSPEIAYMGNYHRYLQRQPGGSEAGNPMPPEQNHPLTIECPRLADNV